MKLLTAILILVTVAVSLERLPDVLDVREADRTTGPLVVPGLQQDESVPEGSVRRVRGEGVGARLLAGFSIPSTGILLPDSGAARTFVTPIPEPRPTDAPQQAPPLGPTATPAPYVPPAGAPEWAVSLICAEHYTWDCNSALNVARCESNFSPNAYNPSGATGIFQMMPMWASLIDGGDLFDPALNVLAAHRLYVMTSGWSHWACRP